MWLVPARALARIGVLTLIGGRRYVMVSADGRLLGETNGLDSARGEYCIACHLAREHFDHLCFVPPVYRIDAR